MKYWQVKEFSKLVGVSIKALHYYDKIGLLKPQSRDAETGYRLYSENSLLQLQQIIALKSFGFDLKQIKKIALDNLSVLQHLEAQERVLIEQIKNLRQAHNTLRLIINQQADGKPASLENVIKLIKEYEMEQKLQKSWESLLSKEQQSDLDKCGKRTHEIFTLLNEENYGSLWNDICAAVTANLNEDPEGPVGKDLGTRWMALVNIFYGANRDLQISLWEVLEEDNRSNPDQDSVGGMSPKVVAWITKAIRFHKLY